MLVLVVVFVELVVVNVRVVEELVLVLVEVV